MFFVDTLILCTGILYCRNLFQEEIDEAFFAALGKSDLYTRFLVAEKFNIVVPGVWPCLFNFKGNVYVST